MKNEPAWLLRGEFTIKKIYRIRLWGGDLGIATQEAEGAGWNFYLKGDGNKETAEAETTAEKNLGKRVQIEYTIARTGFFEYFFDRVSGLNWETPRRYNKITRIIPLDSKVNAKV